VKLLRDDLHALTGVYALDAIDGAERDRFERHLHRCHACESEVGGLHETAGRLALAAARVPPPQLKERVLAAAARTRQLPPLTADRPGPRPQARPSWRPRIAVAFGAAGLAAAIALGFAWGQAQQQLDRAQAQDRAISAVLTAPGARILTADTKVGGTGTIVVAAGQRRLIFTAAGLPPLPASQVYQLWLMGPPRTRSAGLLHPAQGHTAPLLAAGLQRGDQVGVTVEPAGGTAQPTTTPILVMSLP
jgi:anti-sigma-K factor RskA